MSTFLRYVNWVIEQSEANETDGFVSEYTRIETAAEMRIGDLRAPKGLVAWNTIVDTNSGARLICYWSSKTHYGIAKKNWEKALASAYSLQAEGHIGEYYSDKSTLKKRSVLLQNTVLAIAGVLAAFTTIENFGNSLFARPHLIFRHDEKDFSLIQGEPIDLKVVLINQIQTSNENVSVEAVIVPDGHSGATSNAKSLAPQKLVVSEDVIPELTGGEKRDLTLKGKALAPGDYTVDFTTHTTAGKVLGSEAFHQSVRLKIWPERPVTRFELQRFRETSLGIFSGEVDVGRAEDNGVICSLQIERSGKFDYYGLDAAVAPLSPPVVRYIGQPGSDLFLIQWTMKPVKAKQTMPVNIKLVPSGATDWKAAKQASTFECQYAKGGASS